MVLLDCYQQPTIRETLFCLSFLISQCFFVIFTPIFFAFFFFCFSLIFFYKSLFSRLLSFFFFHFYTLHSSNVFSIFFIRYICFAPFCLFCVQQCLHSFHFKHTYKSTSWLRTAMELIPGLVFPPIPVGGC